MKQEIIMIAAILVIAFFTVGCDMLPNRSPEQDVQEAQQQVQETQQQAAEEVQQAQKELEETKQEARKEEESKIQAPQPPPSAQQQQPTQQQVAAPQLPEQQQQQQQTATAVGTQEAAIALVDINEQWLQEQFQGNLFQTQYKLQDQKLLEFKLGETLVIQTTTDLDLKVSDKKTMKMQVVANHTFIFKEGKWVPDSTEVISVK